MRGRQRSRPISSRGRSRGDVLRAVRVALLLPLEVVAPVVGISTSALSAYELGRRELSSEVERRIQVALTHGLGRALDAAWEAEGLGRTTPAPRLRRVS